MVTTPPVPPGRPEDHDDPTGVRALLAGLGDPGPMPADLVDRINASIAAEQLARSTSSDRRSDHTSDPAHDRTVVPLRRRLTSASSWPSWPKVGLAAAAVAAVAVGLPALMGTGPGDVMASLSGSGSADSAAKSAAGAPAENGADQVRPDVGNRAKSGTGTVSVAASGTAYTSTSLTTQARTLLDHDSAFSASSGTSGLLKPATNDIGLRACLTGLGVATWMPVAGDVGTYEGRPAVVAVVSGDTGQSVYAVAPDCDATHPALMAGPLPLG